MKNEITPEVELALRDASDDGLGIYPQSINGVKRSEYQEGWNDAVMEFTRTQYKLRDWYDTIEEPSRTILGELLVEEKIHMMLQPNGDVELYANCNDLFVWGCADLEELSLDQLEEFAGYAENEWGTDKWICIQRNVKPQYPIIWDMHIAGAWDDTMEALPDNPYNDSCGWDQTPTKPWRDE